MQPIADIKLRIEELKKSKMELEFTPFQNKPKTYIKDLRLIKNELSKLRIEVAKFQKMKAACRNEGEVSV